MNKKRRTGLVIEKNTIHVDRTQNRRTEIRTENNTNITYMRKHTHKRHKKVRKTETLPTVLYMAWSSRKTERIHEKYVRKHTHKRHKKEEFFYLSDNVDPLVPTASLLRCNGKQRVS